MADSSSTFNGNIPVMYDKHLGPALFEPYAIDLASRITGENLNDVLELAAGTGRLSAHLRKVLPQTSRLTCTDLNKEMLAVAQQRMAGQNVEWQIADMQELPFADKSFDLIVSQFGLMFPPDKPKAYSEIFRVLKPGGTFLFNTWDELKYNPFTDISDRITASFFPDNPPVFFQTPFCLWNALDIRKGLEAVGFSDVAVAMVKKQSVSESAAFAARGITEGSPLYLCIMERNPSLLEEITAAAEKALGSTFGYQPMISPLQAWVFETVKKA